MQVERLLQALGTPEIVGGSIDLPGSAKSVELNNLVDAILKWKEVPASNIIGIIIFGSSTRPPTAIKRGIWPFSWKTLIHARDVDFLIITDNDLTEDKVFKVKAKIDKHSVGYGGYTNILVNVGLHFVQRGLAQFVEGVKSKVDNISLDAFLSGAVLATSEKFDTALKECCIASNRCIVTKESDIPLEFVVRAQNV